MPKITRDYQEGICTICKKKKLVRVLLNNKRVAYLCKNCLEGIGEMTVNELLNKFGEDINLKAS